MGKGKRCTKTVYFNDISMATKFAEQKGGDVKKTKDGSKHKYYVTRYFMRESGCSGSGRS